MYFDSAAHQVRIEHVILEHAVERPEGEDPEKAPRAGYPARPVELAGERSSGSRTVLILMVVVCLLILLGAGAVVAHLAGVF